MFADFSFNGSNAGMNLLAFGLITKVACPIYIANALIGILASTVDAARQLFANIAFRAFPPRQTPSNQEKFAFVCSLNFQKPWAYKGFPYLLAYIWCVTDSVDTVMAFGCLVRKRGLASALKPIRDDETVKEGFKCYLTDVAHSPSPSFITYACERTLAMAVFTSRQVNTYATIGSFPILIQ